jgi:hypothetical protein
VFVVLIGVAGFLLGLRAGIEIGYRRSEKRKGLSAPKSSDRIVRR